MKEIGGYFELELNRGEEYHKNAIRLNTGRNCLEYILLTHDFKKIYLPYYSCEVLLEPIRKLNIEYEFYYIDEFLNPIFNKKIDKSDVFLFINYFGLKQKTCKKLSETFSNLIIDNSLSFFDFPLDNVLTFNSARKFFGVPDGAYLYNDKIIDTVIEKDSSWERINHLIKRIDLSAKDGYQDFKKNENAFMNMSIKIMSNLTHALLCNIDYKTSILKRNENFNILHDEFRDINIFKFEDSNPDAPMVYPLIINKKGIKEKLIDNNIFIPTYWKNVLEMINSNTFETKLVKNLLPLPIDHRLGEKEIEKIISIIK